MKYAFWGLGLAQSWLWLFFLSGPLLFSDTVGWGKDSEIIILSFLLANSLTYLYIARRPSRSTPLYTKSLLLLISTSLMVAGVLMVSMTASHTKEVQYVFLALAGTIIAGVGSAILITALGELFSLISVNVAGASFAGAVTVGTVIFFLVQMLNIHTTLLLTASSPLLALLCIYLSARHLTKTACDADKSHLTRFPFTRKLVFLLILFYLAGGFLFKIILMSSASALQATYWFTNVIYWLVIVVAGSCLYLYPNLDLSVLYRPVLPLLGAGFLLIPFFHDGFIFLPLILLQAGFALFDLYTWLLFSYISKYYQRPAFVFGWGMFLITVSIFSGETLFTALFAKITFSMKGIDVISLFAALLMLVGTMLFQDKRDSFAGWEIPLDIFTVAKGWEQSKHSHVLLPEIAVAFETDILDIETILDQQNEVTSEQTKESRLTYTRNQTIDYQISKMKDQFILSLALTGREQEVALLLLEGWNNPSIRVSMNISNNTLKSHLKSIYRKTKINNRQELLVLFNKFTIQKI